MTEENLDEHMLRDLQKRTAALPREIAPPENAWDAIKAQIEMESTERLMSRRQARRPFWQRPAFLAAAAFLLVAGSSLVTALVIGRRGVADRRQSVLVAQSRPVPSTAIVSSRRPVTLAQFTALENDYIGTANELSAVIESGKTELTLETIAKLKENLRVIDAAILEARRALAADPANQALIEMLSTSYSQKVDLMKRTAAMGQS